MPASKHRHALSLLLALFICLALAATGHAYTVTLKGEEARRTLHTLELSPYKSFGTGPKVVYVIGNPVSVRSQDFFKATQPFGPFFEFRWLFRAPKDDTEIENDYFGFYEASETSPLEELFVNDHKLIVSDPEAVRVPAALARSVMDVVARDLKQEKTHMPLLIMPTKDGLLAIDYDEHMERTKSLKNLIAPAQGSPKTNRMDALITEMRGAKPDTGKYCAREITQMRILPDGDSRSVSTMRSGDCLDAAVQTGNGWVGFPFYENTEKFGYVYVKASQLKKMGK